MTTRHMSTLIRTTACLRPSFVLVVGALALLVAGLAPVQAQDVFVDDDTCPSTGSGTSGDPYCEIQEAVDNASAGDLIDVAAGTYAENVTVSKSVTLQGASSGTATIDATGGTGEGIVVTVPGVTVDNFEIQAATFGIAVRGVTTTASDGLTITNNTLTFPGGQEFDADNSGTAGDAPGEQAVGIQLTSISGTQAPVIEDNVMGNTSSPFNGPFYGYALFDVQANAATVIEQTTTGSPTVNGVQQGVFIANTDFNTVAPSNVEINGLVMDNFTGESPNDDVNFHAGVFVFTLPDTPNPVTTTIRDVTVRNTGTAGGTSAPPPGCGPTFPATSDCGGQASAGLYFGDFGSTANVRQQTTIERATLTGNDNRGVFVRGKGAEATVTQSTLTDNGDAPFTGGGNFGYSAIAREDGNLTIETSFITGPSSVTTSGNEDDNDLLQTAVGGNLTITRSRLDRNGVGDYTSGTIDASLNAWRDGSITFVNPGATAPISADYSPFLTTGDTDGSTAGFQADLSVLTTDSGSPQLQSETRIEEAIALGGSDNIILQTTGGTYDVSSNVDLPGRLTLADNGLDFSGSGTVSIANDELVVESGVTSITNSANFELQNRFTGDPGAGNDDGWRILSAPRVGMTGADIGQTLSQASSGSILYMWDGSQQGFVQENLTSGSDLTVGKGFFLYLFDESGRDQIDSNPSCASGAACIRTDAELSFADPVSNAFGVADVDVGIPDKDNDTATEAGFVLGNPFAQSFDPQNLILQSSGSPLGAAGEFVASVQAWNPQDEQFEVINTNPSNRNLAPWQGFWMLRASGGTISTETLTFQSTGRTSGAPFIPAKSTTSAPVAGQILMQMRVEDEQGNAVAQSQASLYAHQDARTELDVYDAPRITPPNASYAQVSFVRESDSRRQAQHSVPYDMDEHVEIPLHAEAVGLSGTATISTDEWTNIPADWALTLEDTETGAQTPLVPGETYEFDLTGRSSGGGLGGGVQGGAVSNPRFIVRAGPEAPLPVELTQFTGQADGQAALLSWTTASETNNAGFNVQQQTDAGSYETVQFVEGAGTTDAPQSYQFRLEDLSYGTHTFRLEQVDTDGAATASEPVEVQVQLQEAMAVTPVAPNPVRGQGTARVTVRETQPVQAVLYDALGRRVRTIYDGELQAQQPQALQVEASTLASGTYFLRVQGETAQQTTRFVVVR